MRPSWFLMRLLLLEELVRSRHAWLAGANFAFADGVLNIVQALIKAREAPEQVGPVLIEGIVL